MEKLGQNFLINKAIAKRIVNSANLNMDDFVLEIGPGRGILTEELVKKAGKVVAVEIDGNLVEIIRKKLKNYKNIEIVEGDILKIGLPQIVETPRRGVSTAGRYKLIANLPYYITSPIIRLFLESEFPPTEMILMVQKEVAERIVASPGKMSILSVSVQYYAKPEILFSVGRENFEPKPEVDSCVIRITPHPTLSRRERGKKEKIFPHPLTSSPSGRGWRGAPGEGNEKFFRVVRAGFCAKRKTLANNLANSFHLNKKEVEEKIISAGLNKNIRAQELGVEDWENLTKLFLA